MERYIKHYPTKWQNQYTEEFKRYVVNDFLTGYLSRTSVERKYKIGKSRLVHWLNEFGYTYKKPVSLPLSIMPESSKSNQEDISISKLKKELEDAKLLAETYKRMIEIAEEQLKIDIRKKSDTK